MKVKNKLPLIDKIILFLNALLSLSLLTSYLAHLVDPATIWEFAFFGLAYPFLLMANLIMVIYWLLRRRWYALLPVICIAYGWDVLTNSIGFHSSTADKGKPSDPANIRVMTYNVHNFKRYGAENDISTKHEILDIISHEQPDILGIQEFYTRTVGQYDMRDSIMKIMNTTYYYFEPAVFNKTRALGIAIFSKYPITGNGFIRLVDGVSENACIYIDVKKGNRQLRIYSVHLQSIRFEPEDYKYINSITHDGNTDMSSARRLGSKLKTAFIKRSTQVVKIKQAAAQCPYPYIISGDFNDTPASYAVNYMAKGLKNAFREIGSGLGRTYNGNFPNFQIDYIMVSPQFDVASYDIIQKKLSDHFPVTSDLVLK